MRKILKATYILPTLFIGIIIGGAIAHNTAAWVSGIILLVVDIVVGISLQYYLDRQNNKVGDNRNSLTLEQSRAKLDEERREAMDEITKAFFDDINRELQLAEYDKANATKKYSDEELCHRMMNLIVFLELDNNGLREGVDFDDEAAIFLLDVCNNMPYAPLRRLLKGLHAIRSESLFVGGEIIESAIVYEFRYNPNVTNQIALIYLVSTYNSKIRLFTIENSYSYSTRSCSNYMLCEYAGGHINYGETSLDDVKTELEKILEDDLT